MNRRLNLNLFAKRNLRPRSLRENFTILFFVILACFSRPVLGEVKLSLTVSPTSGPINEEFVLKVVLDGSSETPLLLGGDDFKLVFIGPQTSVTIINGDVTRKVAYSYRLMPKHTGILDSPSAEITIDGIKYQAPAVKVTVSEASTEHKQNNDLFMRQSTDKHEVFLGEQLTNTLEIYSSLALYDAQTVDKELDGFWSENLGEQQKDQRIIDGKSFDLLRVRQALYPVRTGKLTVTAQTLKAKVRETSKSRNPFGMVDPFDQDMLDNFFGGGRFKELTIESNPVELTVKELPAVANSVPVWSDVAPIVGKVDLKLNYDPSEIKVGESKMVQVELKSFGNLNPIKSVPIKVPNWVKVYQEAPTSRSSESGEKLLQRRTFSLTLVPTAGGEVEIAPLELGYFDPEDAVYKVAQTEAIRFKVAGPAPSLSSENKSETDQAKAPTNQVLQQEAAAPTPASSEYPRSERSSTLLKRVTIQTVLFVVLVFAACVLFFILLVHLWRRNSQLRLVISRIRQVQSLADLKSEFEGYLAAKFGLENFRSDPAPFRARLREKLGVEKSLLVETLLDRLNFHIYSAEKGGDLRKFQEEITQILHTM